MTGNLIQESKQLGLTVNDDKTKFMTLLHTNILHSL